MCILLSMLLLGASPLLKYLSVVIPFFLALPALFPPRLPFAFLPVALAFTLAADLFFVLISPPLPLVAISLFLVVQTLYFLFVRLNVEVAGVLRSFCARVVCWILLLPELVAGFGMDSILLLGSAYGVMLVGNLLDAVRGQRGFFAVGMVLFSLCDLSLGVAFLLEMAFGSPLVVSLLRGAAWVFYPPSQTVIALAAEPPREGGSRAQNIIL